MHSVRSIFIQRAKGRLRLDRASLTYAGPAQVLKFTGWHDDGLPFAFVSAPFTGDPVERAGQIAEDLITAHTGIRPMSAPSAVLSGLAATIRAQLKAVTDRAAAEGEQMKASVTNLNANLDTVASVRKEIDTGAAEIQSALGLSTNGGPALDPLETSQG